MIAIGLRGSRLRVRRAHPDDVDATFGWFADPRVTRYLPLAGKSALPLASVQSHVRMEMPQNFKAFIFDLDGTLIDSEAIVDQVMRGWCQSHGLLFSELKGSCHSSRTEDTVASVAPHLDAKGEAERIEKLERDALEGLQEISGAGHFIGQLPLGQWGIATSSTLSTAKAKLNAVEIPIPKVLIAGDTVENGKPHPEAYLRASKELGVEPRQCLAFEDSATGVESALNAGCYVLLVGNYYQTSSSKIIGRINDFVELNLLTFEDSSMNIQIK